LLNILRDLRKKEAKKNNLPPFVIFQDFSLEDMAIQYPVTIDELNNIAGVGTGKAQKFGDEFIRLIKNYVAEKDIIRPQDMVVKSVVNKSGMKVSIIQSIDRQMPLEDIANSKGIEMHELLSEIESIVQSGTKLNLDYYINQVIDEDKQEDIYDYFLEDAESESLEEAIDELGEEDYSEEDIRLMRIKFFSEYGN
jgi:ATP-dependent DNA helicase RecQ